MFAKQNNRITPDSTIVLTIQDRHEYDTLILSIYDELYFHILKTMKNEQNAKDILQDTILKGYNNFQKVRNKDKFKVWMIKVATNICKTHFECQKRASYPMYLEDLKTEFSEDLKISSNICVESELLIKELAIEIRKNIKRLSKRQRKIIFYYYYSAIGLKELAIKIDENYNTVISDHSRALNILKKGLNEEQARLVLSIYDERKVLH